MKGWMQRAQVRAVPDSVLVVLLKRSHRQQLPHRLLSVHLLCPLPMHHISQTSSCSLRRVAARAAKPSLARGAHKDTKFSNEGRAAILKGVEVIAIRKSRQRHSWSERCVTSMRSRPTGLTFGCRS
jgi:hypothetical protein